LPTTSPPLPRTPNDTPLATPPQDQFLRINCQFIEYADPFLRLLQEGAPDTSLIDNLQRFGQTTPLLVWQHTTKQYQLLAGYPTFQAIVALGVEEACCRVLSPSSSPAHRYSLQILHELAVSPASPVLHAHLLAQAQHQLADDELLALLPLMGYKAQRYLLDELTSLLHLSPAAIRALHRGVLAPKAGKLLKLLSHEDQTILVRLIDTYRPGGSKQHKLVEMVTELCLRDNKPVLELVREWLDQECGKDNTPQRFQGLLQSLSARHQPEKTKLEQRFQQLVQELHLPEGVTLVPCSSFEDESVEVRLRFADSKTLQEKWEEIKAVIRR